MKRQILILIIIFSIFAIDFPVMIAYQTSLLSLEFQNTEQTNTFNYLTNQETLQVDFTSAEISHLEDVKKLMRTMGYYFIFLLVIEIFIIIMVYQTDKKQIYKPFLYGGLTSTAVLLLTLLWTVIDFNSVFNLFHRAFFQAGTWIFSPDSKLIQLFPVNFFFNTAKEIFIKALVLSLGLVGLGIYLKKKIKK